MARRPAAELPPIAHIERDEFLSRYWDWRHGEHVSILGPTGWGKTHLAFQLLGPVSTPEAPTIILMMKPRDKTVDQFRKSHGLKRVRSWPPPASVWRPRKPPGFVVQPRHTFDADVDEDRQYQEFRKVLISAMKRGKGVKVFADEATDLQEIKLGRQLSHFLRQARSCEASMFGATQRPYGAPVAMYSQAMHLFIGNDPDKRSQDRYKEIGGIDPDLLVSATTRLQQFQWLYIRRARDKNPAVMCTVSA